MRGIELARLLPLLGAETVVGAPKDQMPFSSDGPSVRHSDWEDLRRAMLEHEREADPALVRLRDGFSLMPADYWLVMLCAAVERYPEAAAAMGILMEETTAHLVTPLAFAQLMQAARGIPVEEGLCAAMGGGTPAKLGLVDAGEPAAGRPLSHQTIRLATAEFTALFGGQAVGAMPPAAMDRRAEKPPVFDEALLRIAAALIEQGRVLCLRGASPRALRQFGLDLATWFHSEAQFFPMGEGPPNLRPALRTRQALPIVDATGAAVSPQLHAALLDARGAARRLVVLAGDGLSTEEFPTFSVPRIGWREAERIWRHATEDSALARRLASRFRINSAEAAAACRCAEQVAAAGGVTDADSRERLIADQVLQEGGRRMGKLVTQLRSQASLADLVAPEPVMTQLTDIVNWQQNSPRVFGEMGMGRHSPLGRGLACLFSGPPGTGKTFAAQCLANELGLNLYRIDLSQVVSKYIGETEKALATIFDEAEAGHGVLLFDEADALFGKRSEVKDAHDRYANIEVGYLLQRLEAYEGIAILATNLRSNIDSAFVRRIRFLLEFPMPDSGMRRRLWDQSLPDGRYRGEDLNLDAFVDRFRLSGGSIQNVGLAAAHMAAVTTDGRITARHLVRAIYRELEKSGRSRDRASFGPLADHLPAEVA